MGGPAMIEGGNLGVFSPEEVGPMSVQVPNGMVDIAVDDEAEAVAVAKKYLSYFQGALPQWRAPPPRLPRRAGPGKRPRPLPRAAAARPPRRPRAAPPPR